jgi:hypothetical protein
MANTRIITRVLLIFLLYLSGLGCAGAIKEFYPDSYFSEDNIYQNRPLHFMLTFRGVWVIMTSPAEMAKASKKFAGQMQKQGAELLFVGATAEGGHGVRGLAVNLNAPLKKYAQTIQGMNPLPPGKDLGLTDMDVNDIPMVRWDYFSNGFRFVEFFAKIDTYNIRIAFWTRPALFERFEPLYLDIISSLTYIERL